MVDALGEIKVKKLAPLPERDILPPPPLGTKESPFVIDSTNGGTIIKEYEKKPPSDVGRLAAEALIRQVQGFEDESDADRFISSFAAKIAMVRLSAQADRGVERPDPDGLAVKQMLKDLRKGKSVQEAKSA